MPSLFLALANNRIRKSLEKMMGDYAERFNVYALTSLTLSPHKQPAEDERHEERGSYNALTLLPKELHEKYFSFFIVPG